MDQIKDAIPRRDERTPRGPTERQLEWMRENIPHFKTAERQARAAKREAAG